MTTEEIVEIYLNRKRKYIKWTWDEFQKFQPTLQSDIISLFFVEAKFVYNLQLNYDLFEYCIHNDKLNAEYYSRDRFWYSRRRFRHINKSTFRIKPSIKKKELSIEEIDKRVWKKSKQSKTYYKTPKYKTFLITNGHRKSRSDAKQQLKIYPENYIIPIDAEIYNSWWWDQNNLN